MRSAPIQLASTDHEAVKTDVYKLVPDWNGDRDTRRLHEDGTLVEEIDGEREPYNHVSGNRIDIIPIPERNGELRIDIDVPEWYEKPTLTTEVNPKEPDHKIA